MKQFLVLAAVLPLMLVFLVQFSLDQINSSRIALLSDCVYTAKEEARQEGCFTEAILSELRGDISRALNVDPALIEIEADRDVKYRLREKPAGGWERGLIHYKVSVPVGQVMAGGRMFGIRDRDNRYVYTIENWAASERLP